jgi:glycosyltransferase involved in cell wall biosynthesis
MLSRTSKAKGHDLLLKAYIKVLEKYDDVQLILSLDLECQDQEGMEVIAEIKSLMSENNLKNKIMLLGCVPSDLLPVFYRNAELFVCSARFEPFGMAVLEAMACQIPVVVSQYAGIQENLVDGEDILKADPNNTSELARTIIQILNDQMLAHKLAEKGRKTVLENFSWDAMAKKLLNFYEQNIH